MSSATMHWYSRYKTNLRTMETLQLSSMFTTEKVIKARIARMNAIASDSKYSDLNNSIFSYRKEIDAPYVPHG